MVGLSLSNLRFCHQRTNQNQALKQHPEASSLPHLGDRGINHGIIEKLHHHELLQSHQVFLVRLIDALDESSSRSKSLEGWKAQTGQGNDLCTCKGNPRSSPSPGLCQPKRCCFSCSPPPSADHANTLLVPSWKRVKPKISQKPRASNVALLLQPEQYTHCS